MGLTLTGFTRSYAMLSPEMQSHLKSSLIETATLGKVICVHGYDTITGRKKMRKVTTIFAVLALSVTGALAADPAIGM